ncbi:hypothetical protein [Pandoraea sputorum]
MRAQGRRDTVAAQRLLRRLLTRRGCPHVNVTDKLRRAGGLKH